MDFMEIDNYSDHMDVEYHSDLMDIDSVTYMSYRPRFNAAEELHGDMVYNIRLEESDEQKNMRTMEFNECIDSASAAAA